MKPTNYSMKGIKPDIIGQLFPYSGSAISFDEHDIQADSISISHGTSVPGAFTVGGVILGSLSLTLLNNPTRNLQNGKPDYTSGKFSNFNWKGSHIKLSLKTDDGTHVQTVYMGDYFVDSHSEAGTTIALQCYDRLKYMDEYQLYEAKQASSNPLTFPTTTYNAIRNICQRRGFSDIRGLDQSIDSLPIADPNSDFMTERQFVSYCAQMLGKYAVVRYSGQNEYLLFTTYNTSSHHYDYDAGTTFSHDLRTEDITVTGVKVTSYDDKYTYTDGTTTGYQIVVDDNPLITNLNCGAVRYRISNAFDLSGGGLTYRPGTVEIVGTPELEAGDIIKVETGQESDIYMIATNIRYGTGLTISVTADADPADTDLRLSRSQYIKKMSKQAISDELNDPTSDLSQAIDGGSGGDDTEYITLPGCTVVNAGYANGANNRSNDVSFRMYPGAVMYWYRKVHPNPEVKSVDMYWVSRLNEYNGYPTAPSTGVEIVSVTIPEQKIKVPKEDGFFVAELLITSIKAPTRDEYFTQVPGAVASDYYNKVVGFGVTPASPAIIKVPMRVYSDTYTDAYSHVWSYRALQFAYDDNGVVTPLPYEYMTPNTIPRYPRSLVEFSAFSQYLKPTWSDIVSGTTESHYAIPICKIPMPATHFCISNVSDEGTHSDTTEGKWCITRTSSGTIGELIVPMADIFIDYDDE